jgi:hypothetical protein
MQYPDMRQLINKVSEDNNSIEAEEEQIAAVAQLIADRTEDANSPSKLSTEAFVGLINKMGLPMTKQTLMDLVEKGQLQSIIKDVNQDEVQFKGQQDVPADAMNVDKAKSIVAGMAKRAAKKGINKESVYEAKSNHRIIDLLRPLNLKWRRIKKDADGNNHIVTMLPNRNIFMIYYTPDDPDLGWATSTLEPGEKLADVFWDETGTDSMKSTIQRLKTWIATDGDQAEYEVDDDTESWS